MILTNHLREHVIRPVLQYLDMHSEAAENLVLGTALVESIVRVSSYTQTALVQLGDGPALGIFQMEPATHDDIWANWLRHKPDTAQRIRYLAGTGQWFAGNAPNPPSGPVSARELIGNLNYAAAMCRAHYRRIPAALPKADDLDGLAGYWKVYYNTRLGKGDPEDFISRYRRWA